eukprot:gene12895-14223_t
MQHSQTSAFVKPRKEHPVSRTAEKISTERFSYSSSRRNQKHDGASERKELKEANNNNDSHLNMTATIPVGSPSVRHTPEMTGIPRRNFSKPSSGGESEAVTKHHKDIQKREVDKNSPKPRRKLPSAPVTSTGPRPRTPKSGSDVSARTTPNSDKSTTSERTKSRGSSVTPEHTRKASDNVSHQFTVSLEKKSKILDDATNVNRKSSDPVETAKTRSIIGSIKYNSLPRRRPSKTRSKFYLDIEGEESLPAKGSHDLSASSSSSEQKTGSLEPKKSSISLENDNEKSSSLFKAGRLFSSSLKQTNNTESILANGVDKLEGKQTHVALYKFIPRHKDEIMLDEGDPLNVTKVADDLWFEGTNLATGKSGIFPGRYSADILGGTGTVSGGNPEDQQFFLRFLGSVEVADYKGDEILCYAISKIVNQRAMLSSNTPPACTLQVTSRGIRVSDFDEKQMNKSSPKFSKKSKSKDKEKQKEPRDNNAEVPTHFFSLKNVTFCGNHPRDRRYFGFITKHPDEHRFACHVFMSKYSTDPVAQAVGDCFKKFYAQYLDYRAPTEDIYME